MLVPMRVRHIDQSYIYDAYNKFSFSTDTPLLRHKRVAALQENGPDSAEKRSPDELCKWLSVEEAATSLNMNASMVEFYTRARAEYEEELRNETPNSKRRRLEEVAKVNSPMAREFISSPYQRKLEESRAAELRAAEEKRRNFTPEPVKKSTVRLNYLNVLHWTIYNLSHDFSNLYQNTAME